MAIAAPPTTEDPIGAVSIPDATPRATKAGRLFYAVSIGTALIVGGLQMYRVHGGWLTDYGADLFGTAWLYAMTRLGKTIFQRGRTLGMVKTGVLIFALCTASEIGQRLHLFPGRFDPNDIVTYGVAILACWGVELVTPLVARETISPETPQIR